MWSRLTRRLRRGTPAPLERAAEELAALERLNELVARIVALLPETVASPEPAPASAPPAAPPPARVAAAATLLFVPSPSGYGLAEAEAGVAPGARVELADGAFRVVRIGPSPLPGDRRRCAFLDREEPPGAERTSDA